ncbi:MAG: hypothetical protein AB8G99_16245 [Planctomycetaceae bacterium]
MVGRKVLIGFGVVAFLLGGSAVALYAQVVDSQPEVLESEAEIEASPVAETEVAPQIGEQSPLGLAEILLDQTVSPRAYRSTPAARGQIASPAMP